MDQEQANGEAYHLLGALLAYPTPGYAAQAGACREQMERVCPPAARHLDAFAAFAAAQPLEKLEEEYTRAFDLAPVCVPYVSVHLFGEDSYKRGELMARLLEAFRSSGFSANGELPDHVGVLLRCLPTLAPAERRELVRYCLLGPVAQMAEQAEKKEIPFAPLLRAAHNLLDAEHRKEDPDD